MITDDVSASLKNFHFLYAPKFKSDVYLCLQALSDRVLSLSSKTIWSLTVIVFKSGFITQNLLPRTWRRIPETMKWKWH